MSPWVSRKQQRWGHTPAGKRALGGAAKVAEWDRETKRMGYGKHIANAAARVHALQAKGGRAEVRAQSREMSKSKRIRVRRKRGKA
jgi:predicted ATPase